MVIDADLKTHIVEGEQCQWHDRTHSSPVSCDEGSLTAWIPQIHIQTAHLRPHPRLLHQLQCPPQSRIRRLLQSVSPDLPQDSPLSPATFSSGTIKGEGETAAWTADLVSTWDESTSARRMTLSSDILHKLMEERGQWAITWWIYNFIHEIHYYFNLYHDRFVCQQWRHHYKSSSFFQGQIEETNSNFPHSQNSFLDLFTSYHLLLNRQILDLSS